MQSIVALIIGGLVTVIGTMWVLGYIAFGNPRCSGSAWSAVALTVVVMLVIFAVFQSLDTLSDWVAAGTATKAVRESQKDMRGALDDQRVQSRTMREMMQLMSQQAKTEKIISADPVSRLGSGGLIFEEGEGFDDIT